MTPEQLAECLRLLALHIADYRSRFGEIPGQDLLDLLGATESSWDRARLYAVSNDAEGMSDVLVTCPQQPLKKVACLR
jgi:hypothetical protein